MVVGGQWGGQDEFVEVSRKKSVSRCFLKVVMISAIKEPWMENVSTETCF